MRIDDYNKGFYIEESGKRRYVPGVYEMDELAQEVVKQMEEAHFRPDLILAIENGGTMPAWKIDHYHIEKTRHIPTVASMRLKSYSKTNCLEDKRGELTLFYNTTPKNYITKKVLIVDDLLDSGKTAERAFELVYDWFGDDVCVELGVLWWKYCSSIMPNFYGKCVGRVWILLPKDQERPRKELFAKSVTPSCKSE